MKGNYLFIIHFQCILAYMPQLNHKGVFIMYLSSIFVTFFLSGIIKNSLFLGRYFSFFFFLQAYPRALCFGGLSVPGPRQAGFAIMMIALEGK